MTKAEFEINSTNSETTSILRLRTAKNFTLTDCMHICNVLGHIFNKIVNLSDNLISSIVFELLTNGVKYSSKRTPVNLVVRGEKEKELSIMLNNKCNIKQYMYYKRFCGSVLIGDAKELYLQRLEHLHTHTNSTRAQLGILTLLWHYNCKIDVMYDDDNKSVTTNITIGL